MCCLELPLLILGVFYIYKLSVLGTEGLKYGMPPEALQAWQGHKRMESIWGIIAIFGSFVIGIIGYVAYALTISTSCSDNYYYSRTCTSNGGSVAVLLLGGMLAPLVLLVVGMVLSWMAHSKANAIRLQSSPAGYVMPGAYPPAQGGWPQQPGAYPPPPAQPGAYPPPPPDDPQAPTGN